MKTKRIIIPTDFSPCSQNAIYYAISMFDNKKTEFILLNAYHFVPLATETYMVTAVDFQKTSELGLKNAVKKVRKKFPGKKGLKLETLSVVGYPADAIAETVKEKKADMVIMGTKGAHGLQEVLVGSHASGVIKKLDCPVLVIPENAKYKTPKKIVVAADFKHLDQGNLIKPLDELARKFKAVVLIIHVQKNGEGAAEGAAEKIRLDAIFRKVPHSFHVIEPTDPARGIEDFIKTHEVDMLTMIARKHSFMENLLNKSVTRKVAMHTSVPLLALHERAN